MPESPQRPFVPHRTPRSAADAVTPTEFRLAPPFVPSSKTQLADSFGDGSATTQRGNEPSMRLRPIEEFLDFSAATGRPAGQARDDQRADPETGDETDELPPLEHFLDPLPPITTFEAEGDYGHVRAGGEDASPRTAEHAVESEWGETDWQQFDWRGAARLGETAETEATNAWATTDWEAGARVAKENRPTAAQAIATALDQIAQKIRDGELAVPAPGAMTDPATIASTLAALLGIKR
ncbi:MAG: hypothetical protein ACJ77J_00430 [Gemmatimonadaceae bacterium]